MVEKTQTVNTFGLCSEAGKNMNLLRLNPGIKGDKPLLLLIT